VTEYIKGVASLSSLQGPFEDAFAKRVGTGHEITCLAWDESSGAAIRIATGTRERLVQVWTFESNVRLQSVFSVQLDVTIPKAICFANNKARDIYIFGLYDGNL
jgi:hypothetical protein